MEKGKKLFFVQNGATDYKIILPYGYTEQEMFAAQELRDFVQKSTKVKLDIVKDTGLTCWTGVQLFDVDDGGLLFTSESKYISLGKTVLAERAEVSVGDELGEAGYVLQTKESCLFILGDTPRGTLNGVYAFLRECLGFDFFFNDCYSLDSLQCVPFREFALKEIPDIENATMTYAFAEWNTVATRRYRQIRRPDLSAVVNGFAGHNALWGYLHPAKHVKKHPEWYFSADNPRQPCFTAHGDEKSLAEMMDVCFEEAKTALIRYPDKKILCFAIEDHNRACPCDSCQRAKEKYGAHSGAMINCGNELMRRIKKWFKTEEGKPFARKLKLVLYAYLEYQEPPVIFDETEQKYKPTIRCDEDVVPFIALVYSNYMYSFYHDINKADYDMVQKWKLVAQEIHFYYYDTNYAYYLSPFNTFDSMQPNYQMAKDCNASVVHNLGQSNQRNYSTGWSILKVYLQSKLVWDVNCDLEKFKDKFFQHYFADGAKYMRQWFDEWLIHSRYIQEEKGFGGYRSLYINPLDKEFFPLETLERWLTLANTALSAIESKKKETYVEYLSIKKHILCERVSLLYLKVKIYGKDLQEEEETKLKETLVSDLEMLGMSMVSEGASIDNLYSDLFKK